MPRMTRSNALHSGWPAALLPKPGLPPALTSVSTHAFPKAARLTKTDEFSSVFALRPVRRSRHFVLYVRANGHPQARLGVVIGKKFAKRAVERNLIKRQCRELFRLRQPSLGGRDVLIRLPIKQGVSSAQLSEKVLAELRTSTPDVEMRRVEFVGPQVGQELASDGALALLL